MAFVPIRGGSQSSNAFAQQKTQDAAQATSLANTILNTDKAVQAKKNEAQRQFENAQAMMREDLNTTYGFDLAALGGPGIAKGMGEYVDKVAQQIREVNDPVEAAKLIGQVTKTYNYLKQAKADREETRNTLVGLYGASAEDIENVNSGLPAGRKVKVPELGDIIDADKSYDRELVVTDDLKIMVPDGKGGLMPIENDQALIDPSAYKFKTEAYDLGGVDNWAKTEATFARTDARTGAWNETDAIQVYIDDITSKNPNGQFGGNAKRNMVLQSLEARNLIPYISQDEEMRRRFEAGDFDMDRVYGVVRGEGEDGSVTRTFKTPREELSAEEKAFRDALKQGEALFVEESKHTTLERERTRTGDKKLSNSKIVVGGQAVAAGLDAGADPATTGTAPGETYNINAFRTPLTHSGSIIEGVESANGNYEITGAGFTPDGRLVATVRQLRQTEGTGWNSGETTETYDNRVMYLTEGGVGAPPDGTMESEIYNFIMQDVNMRPQLDQDYANFSANELRRLEGVTPGQGGDAAGGADQGQGGGQPDAPEEFDYDGFRTALDENQDAARSLGASYNMNVDEATPVQIAQAVLNNPSAIGRHKQQAQEILDRHQILVETGRANNLEPDNYYERGVNVERNARQRSEAQGRQQQQDAARDFFFDNPVFRSLGYDTDKKQGLFELIEGAFDESEGSEVPSAADRPVTSQRIKADLEETANIVSNLSQTNKDLWSQRVDDYMNNPPADLPEGANPRQDGIRSKIEDNKVVFYDGTGMRKLPIKPIVINAEPLTAVATEAVYGHEGYNVDGSVDKMINVPGTENSGVTIGGFDIGTVSPGSDSIKLDILKRNLPADQYKVIEGMVGLKGPKAKKALDEAKEAGLIDVDSWGFTNDTFKEMQSEYIEQVTVPDIKRKIKVGGNVSDEDIEGVPSQILAGIASMEFNVPGTGSKGSALTAIGRAIKSGKKEDWAKAADTYDSYFSNWTKRVNAPGESGKALGIGNINRMFGVADTIRNVFDIPIPARPNPRNPEVMITKDFSGY